MPNLFTQKLNIINFGNPSENRNVRDIQVDYIPEAEGDRILSGLMDSMSSKKEKLAQANADAVKILNECTPFLTDIAPARECIPGMGDRTFLHSGPPVNSFDELGVQLRQALDAAAVHEGFAFNADEADAKFRDGKLQFDAASHHSAGAADCGVISPSMPVFCIYEPVHGNHSYAPLLCMGTAQISDGSSSEDAVNGMIKTEEYMYPLLKKALLAHGDLDVFSIISAGIQCGDECCRRFEASSMFFFRELLPYLPVSALSDISAYLSNSRLMANILIAANIAVFSSIALMPAALLFNLGSNGKRIGARVCGNTDTWFTAELPEDFTCGDEISSELLGLGSVAAASSPLVLRDCHMGELDAINHMYDYYECSCGQFDSVRLPFASLHGAPVADIYRMVRASKPIMILGKKDGKTSIFNAGITLQASALASLLNNF